MAASYMAPHCSRVSNSWPLQRPKQFCCFSHTRLGVPVQRCSSEHLFLLCQVSRQYRLDIPSQSLMGEFQAMQASSREHAGRIPLAFWKLHLKASPAPIICPCHPTSSLLWHTLTQMLPLSTYPNTQALLTKPQYFKP